MTKMIANTYDELGYAKRSKIELTDEQVCEYKLYRKGCKDQGVEPMLADFLAGEIPSCVARVMNWERQHMQQPQRAMGASTGR